MNLDKKELVVLCQQAEMAAKAAGRYIQSRADEHHTQHHKSGGTSLASQVVTAVDLKAQEIILSHLQESIEAHDLGLLTEEAADDQSRIEKPYFWCIDPMDGTLPFTEGRSGYAVSIALVTNAGYTVIGVVYVPDLEDCYASVKGEGIRLNNQPFTRETTTADTPNIYLDRSFQTEAYFESVTSQIDEWAAQQKLAPVQYHVGFGAVRNAVGVMTSRSACYFKFPKKQNGGGSIWDYAATRLFFEELGLSVSDASGSKLQLNSSKTTFMNECGVLYATDSELAKFIVKLGSGMG